MLAIAVFHCTGGGLLKFNFILNYECDDTMHLNYHSEHFPQMSINFILNVESKAF